MSIFNKLMDSILGKNTVEHAVPGAMGELLASMGIHEIGPHRRSGIPESVLTGCQKKLVMIPGASRPAFTKEGKPVMAKDKHGRTYHVMENYAVPVKQWKQMQRDQARKAAGLSYNGEPAADRDARRAKMKAE